LPRKIKVRLQEEEDSGFIKAINRTYGQAVLSSYSNEFLYCLRGALNYDPDTFLDHPEKLMLMALLNTSIRDLEPVAKRNYAEYTLGILKFNHATAIKWFKDRDEDRFMSFRNVCKILDLDPNKFIVRLINLGLLNWD